MPWESKKQQRWGHGRGGKEAGFSEKKLKEWDDKTDFKGLPEEAACGSLPMSSCTAQGCAQFATCGQRTAACGNVAKASCTFQACAQFDTCLYTAPCGLRQANCTAQSCATFTTCGYVAPCGVPQTSCAVQTCAQFATCAYELNWEPRRRALAEELNWTGARPCTEGDDDSQYGPRGDDQKCTDEGGGVPEGFQEVDPEGGDWEPEDDEDGDFNVEEFLDVEDPYGETPRQEEQPLKKTMREEEREHKQELQREATEKKAHDRASLPVPRDPRLGPEEYHQFWQPRERGLSDPAMLPGTRDWAIQKAKKTLEERLTDPMHREYAKTPEDRAEIMNFLMEGPKAGGSYNPREAKRDPGDPYMEDYTEPGPSREPIV